MSLLTDNIDRYAKLRGFRNLQEVAEKAGLSKNIVYRWRQKSANPSKASVTAVANALGVTYDELTGEASQKDPTTVDLKAAINDDDIIMTYEGREIPKEDLEIIKRLLRRD